MKGVFTCPLKGYSRAQVRSDGVIHACRGGLPLFDLTDNIDLVGVPRRSERGTVL